MDLSKAFDTVDHSIRLAKLSYFLILEGGISLNSSCLDVASMRRSCLLATSQSLPVEAMMTFCMLGTGDGLLAAAELQ